jgi:hypothetical protein
MEEMIRSIIFEETQFIESMRTEAERATEACKKSERVHRGGPGYFVGGNDPESEKLPGDSDKGKEQPSLPGCRG